MTSKTMELVREICAYTKKERADVNVGEPDMVKSWLRICRLCRQIEREKKKVKGVS